jgi:L-ascorbate metabolism protein UlaG (beta-lactamase superfamily)
MTDRPSTARVTYIGHASLLFETNGHSVIADPIFSNRVATVFTQRLTPMRFDPASIRNLSAILLTHGHHDHMDLRTLSKLGRSVPVVLPKGLSLPLLMRGFRHVRVLQPWEAAEIDGVSITAVPAYHFGGRPPFYATAGFQGYVVQDEKCVYFSGDTGFYEPMFREIGKKFAIDLAALPIGAYHPPSFRKHHMSPEDALEAFRVLGAKKILPIHYETFNLSWEPLDEPRKRFMAEAERLSLLDSIAVLESGQSIVL